MLQPTKCLPRLRFRSLAGSLGSERRRTASSSSVACWSTNENQPQLFCTYIERDNFFGLANLKLLGSLVVSYLVIGLYLALGRRALLVLNLRVVTNAVRSRLGFNGGSPNILISPAPHAIQNPSVHSITRSGSQCVHNTRPAGWFNHQTTLQL